MREIFLLCLLSLSFAAEEDSHDAGEVRDGKALSVFNVVTFPNSACSATNGYNGTCYTASECTTKGGTASGTCASSFGVCCVFSISCGGSSSANNSYAIISSYSTSTDDDPCTYTFCKTNSDVCKLRIDFDTMVLTGPDGLSSTVAYTDGPRVGACGTDTLTISNPGGEVPPTICGYNTGQHMFITASDQCNQINIDIDTGSTGTTRKWQIKVTQYECGNMMAPQENCLQYHTASTGTIASFNWDTSSSSVSSDQYHLNNQNYDICIRRKRGYCSICFDPYITGSTTAAGSYGIGHSGDPAGTALYNALNALCLGITTENPAVATGASGDYLEIVALQPSPATSTTVLGTAPTAGATFRMCGNFWNAAAVPQTSHATACSYAVPFRVGVHFDKSESIASNPAPTSANLNHFENNGISGTGSGYGYSGFYLNYWQDSC